MKKMCHAFTKANNILATIMLIVSILGIVFGILGVVISSAALASGESDDALVTAAATLIGLGSFLLVFCTISLAFSIVCKVIGKKLLNDLDNGAIKSQMLGKAIALLICGSLGGWIGAGIAIIATPARYFLNDIY